MGKRVLVIDDSDTIQRVVGICLARNDFQLDVASSVDEGLSLARQNKPDVVLVDKGLAGSEKLPSSLEAVPAILLYSARGENVQELTSSAGFSGSCAKPFDFETLNDVVTAGLEAAPAEAAEETDAITPSSDDSVSDVVEEEFDLDLAAEPEPPAESDTNLQEQTSDNPKFGEPFDLGTLTTAAAGAGLASQAGAAGGTVDEESAEEVQTFDLDEAVIDEEASKDADVPLTERETTFNEDLSTKDEPVFEAADATDEPFVFEEEVPSEEPFRVEQESSQDEAPVIEETSSGEDDNDSGEGIAFEDHIPQEEGTQVEDVLPGAAAATAATVAAGLAGSESETQGDGPETEAIDAFEDDLQEAADFNAEGDVSFSSFDERISDEPQEDASATDTLDLSSFEEEADTTDEVQEDEILELTEDDIVRDEEDVNGFDNEATKETASVVVDQADEEDRLTDEEPSEDEDGWYTEMATGTVVASALTATADTVDEPVFIDDPQEEEQQEETLSAVAEDVQHEEPTLDSQQLERQLNAMPEAEMEALLQKVAAPLIEKIAWEVVPDLAENMIKDEIRKIKEDAV